METKHSRYVLTMMGERPERYDWTTGEIQVERYGQSKPYFLFRQNDQVLARLEWPGARRGRYVATDGSVRLDLAVTHMGSRLVAKDELSRISKLHVKRVSSHHRAKMVIFLANSDRFFIQQRVDRANPRHVSLHITKEYYVSELFDIQFVDLPSRNHLTSSGSRTIAKICINRVMRWEARHFHHLIALMVGHIVFIGGHDHFKFNKRHNVYFNQQGLSTVRQGRAIQRHPPRR